MTDEQEMFRQHLEYVLKLDSIERKMDHLELILIKLKVSQAVFLAKIEDKLNK
jgi:predicted RND superfamily exporter protein